MTADCSICGKTCCTCSGCTPVFQNNRWLCPWCAQWQQPNSQQQVVQSITHNGSNDRQVITNYMRKR